MSDIDCFFYKIRSNPRDPELIEQWCEVRRIAEAIRDNYDREVEQKYAARHSQAVHSVHSVQAVQAVQAASKPADQLGSIP